mmetsp:Transcript_13225/g.56341  ORF Transcript_13225/g.56341 Transcript_13225/m.56341 type:complete len:335 (+) Transcript_13225:105-1109(+)
MFRKPLPVTGTHKLGGSDAKRLVKDLAKKLRLDADDAETIVGGKKAVLELVKSPAPSRVQIYLSDGAPIVIDHSGKGDYELTYFALWRAPGALGEPVVLRHCAVTRFLVRGADLMLPGVGAIPSEPFEVGKRFAVTVPGNPKPLAIGETCVGSADVDARGLAAGQKKRFGEVFTHALVLPRRALGDGRRAPRAPAPAPQRGLLGSRRRRRSRTRERRRVSASVSRARRRRGGGRRRRTRRVGRRRRDLRRDLRRRGTRGESKRERARGLERLKKRLRKERDFRVYGRAHWLCVRVRDNERREERVVTDAEHGVLVSPRFAFARRDRAAAGREAK